METAQSSCFLQEKILFFGSLGKDLQLLLRSKLGFNPA